MLRPSCRLYAPTLFLALVAFTYSEAADTVDKTPLISAPAVAIRGKAILTIIDGDFTHPSFSPSGRKLAYASVVEKRMERQLTRLAEVRIRDLGTNSELTLLDAQASKRYAAYSASVIGITWPDETKIVVEIADGDVGGCTLTFAVEARKLIHKHCTQEDEPPDFGNDPLVQRTLQTFPSLSRAALDSGLSSGGSFNLNESGYLLQKRYAGEDDDIWVVDTANKRMRKILDLPEGGRFRLANGFASRFGIVFAVIEQSHASPQRSHIFLLADGRLRRLRPPGNPRTRDRKAKTFSQVDIRGPFHVGLFLGLYWETRPLVISSSAERCVSGVRLSRTLRRS
jgi:hypothetical protein